MSRLSRGIVWVYAQLLRLYPVRFRHEFADEMTAVFGQVVQESDDAWSLVGLLLGEVRDLPVNVIRAHVEERSENTNRILEGDIIVMSGNSPRTFRLCTLVTLAGVVIYTLTVVIPFFVLGIHLQPADRVAAGFFDPTNLPLYGGDFGRIYGNIFWMATILVLIFAPLLEMVLGSSLFVMLLRNRTLYPQKQYLIGSFAAFTSISLVLFAASPLGRLILAWWLD